MQKSPKLRNSISDFGLLEISKRQLFDMLKTIDKSRIPANVQNLSAEERANLLKTVKGLTGKNRVYDSEIFHEIHVMVHCSSRCF